MARLTAHDKAYFAYTCLAPDQLNVWNHFLKCIFDNASVLNIANMI